MADWYLGARMSGKCVTRDNVGNGARVTVELVASIIHEQKPTFDQRRTPKFR